ncbi:MAG: 16S rRNA (cytosine(1402)-N(4))-methyltransferase RsmH [Pseudomonadaceae bacterium]|nr:16S rRNA (cytosine(1402)-N(4))-methyltransferase RsmH [Pseudomonadaceae bacterium]
MSTRHIPVLLHEVVAAFGPLAGKLLVDGTLGGGGHTRALLDAGAARVVGFDRDAGALERVGEIAGLTKVQGNFVEMGAVLDGLGVAVVDGVLLDLGYSSDQMDDAARGMSYSHDGPLDMRMDVGERLTAAEIVNGWREEEIADVLWRYGEEPKSRAIARKLVAARKARPLETTGELLAVLDEVYPPRGQARSHPAARTFQALRVAVNHELADIEAAVPQAAQRLAVGGRLVVITFNSLEDKLVKRLMQGLARDELDNVGRVVKPAVFKMLKKVMPSAEEVAGNRRARSCKLRVLERVR